MIDRINNLFNRWLDIMLVPMIFITVLAGAVVYFYPAINP